MQKRENTIIEIIIQQVSGTATGIPAHTTFVVQENLVKQFSCDIPTAILSQTPKTGQHNNGFKRINNNKKNKHLYANKNKEWQENIQPGNTKDKQTKCQNPGKEQRASKNVRNLPCHFGAQETKLILTISFQNTIDYGLKGFFLVCPFFCLSPVDIVHRPHAGCDKMFWINLSLSFILLFVTFKTFNVQCPISKKENMLSTIIIVHFLSASERWYYIKV